MTTYRYEPEILVTDKLINNIFDWSGAVKTQQNKGLATNYLSQILHSVLGLPVAEDRFGEICPKVGDGHLQAAI